MYSAEPSYDVTEWSVTCVMKIPDSVWKSEWNLAPRGEDDILPESDYYDPIKRFEKFIAGTSFPHEVDAAHYWSKTFNWVTKTGDVGEIISQFKAMRDAFMAE